MGHPIRCAQCDKVIIAANADVIFWKPGDKPYGLHKGCEKAYEGSVERIDMGPLFKENQT